MSLMESYTNKYKLKTIFWLFAMSGIQNVNYTMIHFELYLIQRNIKH